MADIYTYYLDFYDGEGLVETEIYQNELSVFHKRDEKYVGIVNTTVDGSFQLNGANFQKVIDVLDNYGIIEFAIELNSSFIYYGAINDFCDKNYNEQTITLKNFTSYPPNSFRYYKNKTFLIESGSTTLFQTAGIRITNRAHKLITLLESIFTDLSIYENFDSADFWYDSGISIDFDDLRIANMRDMYNVGSTGVIGGARKSLTLEQLIDIICQMFNITITLENDDFKFKKYSDLLTNKLDLSSELVLAKIKNYDLSKLYNNEILEFNDNNLIAGLSDYKNTELLYNLASSERYSETLTHDLKSVTTLWTFSDDISQDGIFLGLVNPATEILDASTNGYVSGIPLANVALSPANLLNSFYRDFIFTDKKYFSICGNNSANAPTYFNRFIEIPEITTKIADPSIFYDCIILEKDGIKERVGLTIEQKTKLSTNQTTIKVNEFVNQIN